jgi:hypothetical protein
MVKVKFACLMLLYDLLFVNCTPSNSCQRKSRHNLASGLKMDKFSERVDKSANLTIFESIKRRFQNYIVRILKVKPDKVIR